MADNASQSINNPLASGGLERPPDPRPLVPSTYGVQWTFSLLAPVKFRAGSATVFYTVDTVFPLNMDILMGLEMLEIRS